MCPPIAMIPSRPPSDLRNLSSEVLQTLRHSESPPIYSNQKLSIIQMLPSKPKPVIAR